MDVLKDKPVGDCFCATCLWFSMAGYEESNELFQEDGYKMGHCTMFKRSVQQCDFCYLGLDARKIRK